MYKFLGALNLYDLTVCFKQKMIERKLLGGMVHDVAFLFLCEGTIGNVFSKQTKIISSHFTESFFFIREN